MNEAELTLERYKAEQLKKSAASWFVWIGGLSLVNSIMAMNGTQFSFTFGLGFSQIGDAMLASDSPIMSLIGFFIAFGFAGFFILLSWLARHTSVAFPVGIAAYSLDTVIFLVVQDWLGFGFHLFALFLIVTGWRAHRKMIAALPPAEASAEATPAHPVTAV